jgi:16S rRNA (uracil1498-N3)-methyltransferase
MKRPHLIFVPFFLKPSQMSLVLCDPTVLAQMKALRLAEESDCILFDENNLRGLFRIEKWTKKNCTVKNVDWITPAHPHTPQIQLIQCLPKGNKIDMILQKATELGVTSIQVLCSERCVPILNTDLLEKKTAGYRQTIREAVRQSEIPHIPQVFPIMEFATWAKKETEEFTRGNNERLLKLTFCEEKPDKNGQKPSSHQITPSPFDQIRFLIGPEGGLTPEENSISFDAGFVPVHLPGGVLRVETAAIVALSLLRFAKTF